MTEQQLQEIEASHYRMPVVLALIAEIRRLREQQGRELIARVDAIEQGNSLAQRQSIKRRQHQKGCPSLGIGGAVERNCTCGVNALRVELTAARQEVTDRERIIGELQAANQRLAKDSARVFACWDEGHRLAVAEASKRQDAEVALTEARRVLKHVLSELKQTSDWGVVDDLQTEIAAVLAQEEAS